MTNEEIRKGKEITIKLTELANRKKIGKATIIKAEDLLCEMLTCVGFSNVTEAFIKIRNKKG